ncbi:MULTISPECIES: hypothetical protein [Actinotignum]|uniref:hypothetical protein n=1 Tax=Actinotignum TaxID=1653174 RepID=UPI00254B59F3|nr:MULTISPECIES: hypothetical protein [Actinotignum]MDE1537072.1 hypothetical protein [Actinotignum schaalii]MDK7272196.1 hypothetical protein [Actinotignum schaalii]MDY5134120.1 hypothetical protein [Actinotignum timonense]MDY5144546.1 hypothetical protein [Actinotignum timonense]
MEDAFSPHYARRANLVAQHVQFKLALDNFDLIALEIKLGELLGKPVDIMSSKSEGYVADYARSEAIEINHGKTS